MNIGDNDMLENEMFFLQAMRGIRRGIENPLHFDRDRPGR